MLNAAGRNEEATGLILSLNLVVSMVTWIVVMLTLLPLRKVGSSVIFPLIPFAFHCISSRQLVDAGVVTDQGFISISPHTEAEVVTAVLESAAPPTKRRFD